MGSLCSVCGLGVHDHEDTCVRCTSSLGYPNVRFAQTDAERQALIARAELGRRGAEAVGAVAELDRIMDMAEIAPIAFNRSIQQLFQWCEAPDQNFKPWIWHVNQGRRVYPDEFNSGRLAFEHNVNPNYSQKINFCYLDSGNVHLLRYGAFKVRFRRNAVSHRTTFLETNAYYFCHKHKIVDPSTVPRGYRSTWDDLRLLVEAKLGSRVKSGMSDTDLADLLLSEGSVGSPEDFLEAHVYNPLHVSAIESISGTRPSSTGAPILEYVRSVLEPLGVRFEIR